PGGRCDLEKAIFDFPEGKVIGPAYYVEANRAAETNLDNSKVREAQTYFSNPLTRVEIGRAQQVFEDAKKLAIAYVTKGRRHQELNRSELRLVSNLQSLEFKIL